MYSVPTKLCKAGQARLFIKIQRVTQTRVNIRGILIAFISTFVSFSILAIAAYQDMFIDSKKTTIPLMIGMGLAMIGICVATLSCFALPKLKVEHQLSKSEQTLLALKRKFYRR